MNTLSLVDGAFVLTCGARYRDWASKVLGMRYNFRIDAYTGPATWASYVSVTGIFGEHLVQDWTAIRWADSAEVYIDDVIITKEQMTLPDHVLPLKPLGEYTLYDYQQVDAYVLSLMGSALVTSEMRTGKCGVVLGALRRLGISKRILIVATNGNRYTWEEEIAKWSPLSSVSVVGGTAAQRKKALAVEADFTVIHYDVLSKHSSQKNYGSMSLTPAQKQDKELNNRFDAVILDEAHFIKDPTAQRTRCAWALGDTSQVRFALTGTPIANNPLDLWAILRFLYPKEFTSKSDFTDRYAMMVMNVFGGMDCFGLHPGNKDEFYKLFEPKYIRRLRKDVLPFLPDKTYSTVWVDLETKQRKMYDAMAKNMMCKVGDEMLVATDPLTKSLRLHQLAAATPVVGAGIRELGNGESEAVSTVAAMQLPSATIDALLDILQADDEQALVLMQSRKLLDLCELVLEDKGITFASIKGGTGDKVREEARKAFQTKAVRVCLFIYDASPEGLDFSNCWRTIRLQPTSKMTKSVQGEDRTLGPAQTATKIEIIDIIARDTVQVQAHHDEIQKEVTMHELVQDTEWTPREVA